MKSVIEIFSDVTNACLTEDASRLVLALSGGLDSRVMLECLSHYQLQNPTLEVRAVHVHHGLSHNADHWVEQCRLWCEEANISFYVEFASLDVNSKQSLEAQAREARYALLSKHLNKNDLLLTAQHVDDQLETLLLALKRGSGPRGLAAMGAKSAFGEAVLVRPFLSLKREALEAFAKQQQLEWVEDESNQDTQFDRNFLRHQVIPVLSARWPEIQAAALRSAQLCFEQEQLLDELLEPHYQSALNIDDSLNADVLSKLSDAIRNRLLRRWFAQYGLPMPGKKQLGLIYQEVIQASQDANPKLIIGKVSVRRFQKSLFLIEQSKEAPYWQSAIVIDTAIELPNGLGLVEISSHSHSHSHSGLLVRAPKLDEKVWVQFNPGGLTAHPEERSGSRKLKKLFQEYQIPPWKRSQTPILMYNEEVVAVGDSFVCRGYTGSSHRFNWKKHN
ncbi:tRNA(Ile)-lysidine synthase [Vibrio inusitatus NBRC 102082]|uniref:tRNA(Ile)-lysidine synthase n=1 Tax=Vibrio inusitatus NBRC 102082 TaxID=1219070 RepID=A0A4Y3HQQ7_9VIBR|nr:tRNA lysidine(34) synthetase TilS [Vibrio inusitatus]GEA49367.1 tRNA(Ile)-lysidine synthase [Vibrio inusitatus NBRC 102082]